MAIDRIGKGGAPPAPASDTKTGAVDKPFTVERTKHAAPIEGVTATSPLAELKAGKIDMDRYLDLKVDEATKSLEGLPPADLADIKQMLRVQLASDPGLVDMVRSATGKVPNPPENE